MNAINEELLHHFMIHEQSRNNQAFSAALAGHDINEMLYIPDQGRKLNGAFTIEVKTHGITNQKNTGRCWLFAALNILREEAAVQLNAEQFEFSENYLAFYDKLEKANNFLESIIKYTDEPVTSRHNAYILGGIGDGNVWSHAVYLLKKYGAVPKEIMPETYQSEHTSSFLKTVNALLRKDASLLRKAATEKKDVQKMKEEMLAEIYHIEVICFGQPPRSFDYCYRDRDDAYHEINNLTPQQFLKNYTKTDLDDYVHVVNEPDLEMYQLTAYHSRENAVDEDRIRLNLPMDDIEAMILKTLKDGKPVWFGCESRAWQDRNRGIWDPDSFALNSLFQTDFTMEKADALQYHAAYAAHNMLLTGVHLDENGKPDRWKIENSWGEENGLKGIFVCSEKYFQQFVFEAALAKKYMNSKQLTALNNKPVYKEQWEIETWD